MATALETSSQQRTPNTQANLVFASVSGAVYVLASLAIVLYAVPHLFRQLIGADGVQARLGMASSLLLFAIEVAVFVGLIVLGRTLAGQNPPKGLRGGIFLVISTVFTLFFIIRAIGLNVDGSTGAMVTAAVGAALVFATIRFFASMRAARLMIGLEHSGLFHATTYKRLLGQKLRRLTILGILLLGGSGVYSMWSHSVLPAGDWILDLPFTNAKLTLLPDLRSTAVLLLMGLTIWFAWRVVNMPTFAEFLIATEAEMNKVSWSTRRQLTQDTIVVLITTLVLTLFLFAVDIFWGWLLSQSWVGVLPSKTDTKQKESNQVPKW